MDVLDAALLGLIQGITEFLPVSSDGHLSLARAVLGFAPGSGALFEVLLHQGTALSIAVVFRRDLVRLCGRLPILLRPSRWRMAWREDPVFRILVLMATSAVPAGVIGIAWGDEIESLFDVPMVAAVCLLVTGAMLLTTRWARPRHEPLGFKNTLVMGFAQATALLPGISRSATTITTGIWLGCDREDVGRFSFLMGLVPIIGAGLLKMRAVGDGAGPSMVPILVGIGIACATGIFALQMLLRFVARGRLHVFAPYCFAVGGLGIVILSVR